MPKLWTKHFWPPDDWPPSEPLQDERLECFCECAGGGQTYKRAAINSYPELSRTSASDRARKFREYPAVRARTDYIRARFAARRASIILSAPQDIQPSSDTTAPAPAPATQPPQPAQRQRAQDNQIENNDLPDPQSLTPEEFRAIVSRLARQGVPSAITAYAKLAEADSRIKTAVADPARLLEYLRLANNNDVSGILRCMAGIYGQDAVKSAADNL